MIRRNFWQSLKKILKLGFRATLNFQTFKVVLNSMYRLFLKFDKSCVLSCVSKNDNIKKSCESLFGCLRLGAVMARNLVSQRTILTKKMSQLQSSLIVTVLKRVSMEYP